MIVTVPGLILTLSCVNRQCVIVIFPNRNRLLFWKVSKGAKIRIRYNQVPHLTQDTDGKVTN